MRVLMVAGYFPPAAPLSATRVVSLARFVTARGHDVRIVAARNAGHFPAIVPDVEPGSIFYERKPDLDRLSHALARGWRRVRAAEPGGAGRGAAAHAATTPPAVQAATPNHGPGTAARLYDALVKWPDAHAAWIPFAVARGRRVIDAWSPDVIYASAPPHSGLVVAARLSRRSGIPWVAELRDLWVDHPYYDAPAWRRWIDRRIESRTLRSAAGIISVTRGWVELLAKRFRVPTTLVMNGYDAADYGEPGEGDRLHPQQLSILYTGGIYPGKRDPSPLFEALARLGAEGDGFRVHFFGEELAGVVSLARRAGVERLVEVNAPVTHDAAIALQKGADVLLLLRWRDEREGSVIPGKLFEYIGAGRPILCLGLEGGEAADLVAGRSSGIVSNDPAVIAEQLARWRAAKAAQGWLPGPSSSARAGLSREEQFESLESFLRQIAAKE